jgi:YVTN family beta-propeller protein
MLCSIALAQSGGLLLVANQGDHTLSIINPESGDVAKVTSHDVRGHEVVASADGKLAYLPIYGDSGVGRPGTDGQTIEVIDIQKKSVVATIDLGGGPARPHCVRLGPGGLIYVSAELEKAIAILDPATQKRVGSIPTGQPESHMFVFSKDGSRAYTSNVGVGTVSVLDVAARKTLAVIPVTKIAQRIAISTDDRYVFTADQGQPRLAVIDTRANKVSQWIDLPTVAYGTAPTPDGKALLITLPGTNQVAVLDLASMRVVRTLEVPAHPQEVLMRTDQPIAYVSSSQAGKVAVIDTRSWTVKKVLDSGPGADGLGWAKTN